MASVTKCVGCGREVVASEALLAAVASVAEVLASLRCAPPAPATSTSSEAPRARAREVVERRPPSPEGNAASLVALRTFVRSYRAHNDGVQARLEATR